MNIKDYVKYLRIKKGLSCRALARKSGVSHTAISDIESGLVKPSIMTIYKICEGLDEDIFDFFAITNYLKNENIQVGKGEIFSVIGNRAIVDFDNGIENYQVSPEIIYIKSNSHDYIIQKVKRINNEKRKMTNKK